MFRVSNWATGEIFQQMFVNKSKYFSLHDVEEYDKYYNALQEGIIIDDFKILDDVYIYCPENIPIYIRMHNQIKCIQSIFDVWNNLKTEMIDEKLIDDIEFAINCDIHCYIFHKENLELFSFATFEIIISFLKSFKNERLNNLFSERLKKLVAYDYGSKI